jgi:flagellar hook protein FlgE
LATASATAVGAKLLSDAAASAAAALDDKIATNVGDLSTQAGTFATLLTVPTIGLDGAAGGQLVSTTSNDWQTAKTALVTANQAKAAADTAFTTADSAVKAAGGAAAATPAQNAALAAAVAGQAAANADQLAKVGVETAAATAFGDAVLAYVPPAPEPPAVASAADIAMSAAITAYNDATGAVAASSLGVSRPVDGARAIYDAAFKANAEAVAKNCIGTLQFVDGQLLGSLTKDYTGKGPSVPTVLTAQLSDTQNLLLYGVKFDLSSMTSFGSADIVREASANGYAPGALSGVNVDSAGLITGQYSNGKTLVGGQLVLASFASSDGLQPASGTVFTETFASGAAVLGSGTTGSFGSIRSSNLEQSNIDMAAELVNLMIQQRNYQANSQGISAANTVMTTAINMGR